MPVHYPRRFVRLLSLRTWLELARRRGAWILAAMSLCHPLRGDDVSTGVAPDELRVTAPPRGWRLAPFYKKHVSAGGFPVLGSAKVSDFALVEAAWLINHMLADRPDIRRALIANKVRFVVMAVGEKTTDVPEHSDLRPTKYWDRRARGLGATHVRPAVSCGEENLLQYPGDPYSAENILVHEFAHAIHQMGLNSIDRTFDERLQAIYDSAMEKGLWKEKYAAHNRFEYWAEGVQSYFDTNRQNDHDHNAVDTRAELEKYDPDLAALIAGVFRDTTWRYEPPRSRARKAHLAAYDPLAAPTFSWSTLLPDGGTLELEEPPADSEKTESNGKGSGTQPADSGKEPVLEPST